MLFSDVEALNNDFVDLWQRPRNRSSLPPILAGDNQDGITLFDVHLGKVERLLLFLFCCHIFPLRSVVFFCCTGGKSNFNANQGKETAWIVSSMTFGGSEM